MLLLKKKNVMGRKEEAPVRGYRQKGIRYDDIL
jgi:hypothetical protein